MNVRTLLGWNYHGHFSNWNHDDTRYLICHRNESHYKLWLIRGTRAARSFPRVRRCFLIYENKRPGWRAGGDFRRSIDDQFAWPDPASAAVLTATNFSKIRGCSGSVYRRLASVASYIRISFFIDRTLPPGVLTTRDRIKYTQWKNSPVCLAHPDYVSFSSFFLFFFLFLQSWMYILAIHYTQVILIRL